MVYKRVVVWGSFIAQWSCNTIAIACPMQVGGGGNHMMIGSFTKALK